MDKIELIKCIEFFNEIKVIERDVSTDEEVASHSKVVLVDYFFKGKKHTTNKLYYKDILQFTNEQYKNNKVSTKDKTTAILLLQ